MSRVTKSTIHIVILILLTACVTNQCSQFFLYCHNLLVFNKLCAKCQVVITLGQIKLTFGI